MNIKLVIGAILIGGLLAGCESENSERSEATQAKLMAKAKISKADATTTAMGRVPNGTIKEAELEKEQGKLIWSFDMTTPDSKDITEVAVNAITGEIVSIDKESPENEKKEAAGEKN